MIALIGSFLAVIVESWHHTPGPVKAIVIAAFGALIGAFLTSRSQAKRRVVEELRAIHAAYTISLAIVNKALAVKRQHLRPMKRKYESDLATYDEWMERPRGPIRIEMDLRTISKLRFANAVLERTVFEKISLGHKGLAAVLSLEDATDDLNTSIEYRNGLIVDFQKNAPPEQEDRIAFYVGAYRDGKVDARFSDNIDALAHQADDCIYFGTLLSEELLRRERSVRTRNWWKYRLAEVPRQYPADWTVARTAGLLPDASQYADWQKGFKKPPTVWNLLLGRY